MDPCNESPRSLQLSDEERRKIVELVKQDLFAEVGKGVLSKVLYLGGLCLIALASWLAGKGYIRLGE